MLHAVDVMEFFLLQQLFLSLQMAYLLFKSGSRSSEKVSAGIGGRSTKQDDTEFYLNCQTTILSDLTGGILICYSVSSMA